MIFGQNSSARAPVGRGGPADALRCCQEAYAAGRPLALLFDYDGTLVPICPSPEWARLSAPTRRRLVRLARRPRVAVGIVSGRSLDELRRMCLLEGVVYVGTGGFEWDVFGKRGAHPRAHEVRRTVTALYRRLADALAPFTGAWVENKHLALAVHYRQVPEDHLPALAEALGVLLEPYRPAVRVVQAPKALEIYPEVGWDKGSAVRWLAQEVFGSQALLLYAGDAPNDEPALSAVESLGGVAVAVGTEVQAAYALPDPQAVGELLAALDAQLADPLHDLPDPLASG